MKSNTLVTNERRNKFLRITAVVMMLAIMVVFASSPSISMIFADGEMDAADTALSKVMGTVINIIKTAALYIGIVVVLWGVFQIVLAFRREDSEGISKQITTVVVGGVLVGFGAIAGELYESLTGQTLPED